MKLELELQVLTTQLAAKQNGYADVVYLDAKTDTYLEEVSSCNIFTVKDKHIRTPALQVCFCAFWTLKPPSWVCKRLRLFIKQFGSGKLCLKDEMVRW